MEYLNSADNDRFDGCSLIPLIESTEKTNENRTLYSESWSYQGSSTFFGKKEHMNGTEKSLAEACARNNKFKYIWRNKNIGKDGFYNHNENPFETQSLPMDNRGKILKKELLNYMLPYHIKKMDMTRLLGHTK
jgi:ssDNA-binding Zn-finger/Zn-ribbon topoisomerase 1